MLAELVAWRRRGGDAVGVDEVQALARLARLPCPRRAAGCVARREYGGDTDVADFQRLAVPDDLDVLDRRVTVEFLPETVLRIIGGVLTALQGLGAARAGRHGGIGEPLQRGNAAGMIEMTVRVDDQF